MTARETAAFNHLLAAWRHREECRDTGSIRELAEARFALEHARDQMRASIMNPR